MKLNRYNLRRLIENIIMEQGSGGLSAAGKGPGGGGDVEGLGDIGADTSKKSGKVDMSAKRKKYKDVDDFMAGLDFGKDEDQMTGDDLKVFVIMQPDGQTVQSGYTYAEKNGEYFYVKQADYKGKDSKWKKMNSAGIENIKGKFKDRLSPIVFFSGAQERPIAQPGFTLAMATGEEKIEKKLSEGLSRGSLYRTRYRRY